MGLSVRDDPPRTFDLTGREWGESVNGLVLSLREVQREDADQLPVVSVMLRNDSAERKCYSVPDWLYFCEIEMVDPAGAPAPRSAFGEQRMQARHDMSNIEIALAPGEVTGSELPIGAIYPMRAPGVWRIRIACEVGGGRLLSNRISLSV